MSKIRFQGDGFLNVGAVSTGSIGRMFAARSSWATETMKGSSLIRLLNLEDS